MKKVLCFGEVLIDFLPNDDSINSFIPIAGGAPANVAVAVAKLGGESCFVGGVSQDNFGCFLTTQLQAYRVDTSYLCRVRDKNTAVVLVSLDQNKERSFNFYRHDTADMQFCGDDFNHESFCRAGIFHFCSNTLTNQLMTDTTLAGLKMARDHDLIVSLDINLRLSLWSDSAEIYSRISDCLAYTDIIKFSREELDYLSQQAAMAASDFIAMCFDKAAQLIVVTDGANDIVAYTRDHHFAISVPTVALVDTTAAGDAFVGALLFQLAKYCKDNQSFAEHVKNELLVKQAVTFASQCGAFTCTQKGAFPALPTFADYQLLAS